MGQRDAAGDLAPRIRLVGEVSYAEVAAWYSGARLFAFPSYLETFGHPLDAHYVTARLWGIADTAPYLHDARALTLTDAIQMHGGEAQASADAFAALYPAQVVDLLAFLHTLRTPKGPNQELLQ